MSNNVISFKSPSSRLEGSKPLFGASRRPESPPGRLVWPFSVKARVRSATGESIHAVIHPVQAADGADPLLAAPVANASVDESGSQSPSRDFTT